MKTKIFTLLFSLCFAFSNTSFSRNLLTYSEVVEIENASADQLYVNAHYWAAHLTHYAKFIENNPEERTIRIFDFMSYQSSAIIFEDLPSSNGEIRFNIKIEAREGRYKYTIDNFEHLGNPNDYNNIQFGLIHEDELCLLEDRMSSEKRERRICEKLKKQIDERIRMVKSEIRDFMKNEIAPDAPFNDRPFGIIYSSAYEVDDVSQATLFNKAKIWFKKSFPNSDRAIVIEDEKNGELFGFGFIPYKSDLLISNENTIGVIEFSVRVKVEADFYRYSISNFTHISNGFHGDPVNYGVLTADTYCWDSSNQIVLKKYKEKVCVDIHELLDRKMEKLTTDLFELIKATVDPPTNLSASFAAPNEILFSDLITLSDDQKENSKKVKNWMNRWATDLEDIQESSATERDLFIGKVVIPYDPAIMNGAVASAGIIHFDVEIQIQNDQCKYLFRNFAHEADPFLPVPISYGDLTTDEICFDTKNTAMSKKRKAKVCSAIQEIINTHCSKMIESLSEKISTPTDDW